MTRIFKSNKFVLSLIIILSIFLIFNPKTCSNSCLNAISVWFFKIFPVMFPFFVLSRIIIELSDFKVNRLNKYFSKIYNTPGGALNIFCLSALAGYPMGAKLIGAYYEQGYVTQNQARRMLSFCSISGPMFMIGTVGVAVLKSFKAGVVILIANLLSGLANGLIYRGKNKKITPLEFKKNKKENILTDAVCDSLISILLVAGFIVLSFVVIDAIKSAGVLRFISRVTTWLTFNKCDVNVIESIITGLLEITRGIINIGSSNLGMHAKTIISSSLVGFGGISIMLQSVCFVKKINVKFSYLLLQKFTQCLITLIFSSILVFIVF